MRILPRQPSIGRHAGEDLSNADNAEGAKSEQAPQDATQPDGTFEVGVLGITFCNPKTFYGVWQITTPSFEGVRSQCCRRWVSLSGCWQVQSRHRALCTSVASSICVSAKLGCISGL